MRLFILGAAMIMLCQIGSINMFGAL